MRIFFKEVDLFQLAAGNPDLDAALAKAIQKANLSGVDLLVMHMLMLGYSQAEIARHMEYSKMAITKAKHIARVQLADYLNTSYLTNSRVVRQNISTDSRGIIYIATVQLEVK